MPARRDYTPQELAAKLERDRERARVGMRQLRQRRRVNPTPVNPTHITEGTVTLTPPPSHTLPSPGLSTTDRLLERLAPFGSRSFKPDPAFLALLAERYPAVDLELELAAALDWLEEPRHAKRRCSKGFLANWVKKADADRKAREALPPPATVRDYRLPGGGYVQPQALQHNRQPDKPLLFTHDLKPVAPEEWRRALDERRAVPFNEKLAAARNGVHK